MKITLFVAKKFRMSHDSVITDYVRDSFDVEADTPLVKIAEIINQRMDELDLKLNQSIYAQLRAHAS